MCAPYRPAVRAPLLEGHETSHAQFLHQDALFGVSGGRARPHLFPFLCLRPGGPQDETLVLLHRWGKKASRHSCPLCWGVGEGWGWSLRRQQTHEQQKTPPTCENFTEAASCPQRRGNLKLNFSFSFPPFSSEISFAELHARSSSSENIRGGSRHGAAFRQEEEQ